MNKQEFLMQLKSGLSGLPKEDVEERLDFYSEMIDDRVEEGFLEEEAIQGVGDIEGIINQMVGEIPLTKLVKQKIKQTKQLRVWEITLLIIGSPLWLSLLIAVIAAGLSVYIALWAVVISFWSAFGAIAGCAVGGVAAGIVEGIKGDIYSGIAMIGAGIICIGLSIFAFYGCKAITNGILLLTKKISVGIKNCLIKKEEA